MHRAYMRTVITFEDHARARAHAFCMPVHMFLCMPVYMPIHMCVHVSIYAQAYPNVYTQVQTGAQVSTHVYAHVYTKTHTYTYAHDVCAHDYAGPTVATSLPLRTSSMPRCFRMNMVLQQL